jgi:flagellar motor switch protein FliG
VLIRSLDADSAAKLLAQLSPEEAAAVRAALRELGSLDPDEQADVVAEFRRTAPMIKEEVGVGVALELESSTHLEATDLPICLSDNQSASSRKRFEFLDRTPVEDLVPCLAREHPQTIAVVLFYLPPSRAAAVLAGLPSALQAEAIERLSTLGDTDPDSLNVVERELGAWVAQRMNSPRAGARCGDTLMSILAAADAASRDSLMVSLKAHKASLAKRLAPLLPARRHSEDNLSQADDLRRARASAVPAARMEQRNKFHRSELTRSTPNVQPPKPDSRHSFASCTAEDLVRLSTTDLAAVLRQVDANVLLLALTGSSEQVVSRICNQMPRRAAKALRRQLGLIGPTRLSDVAAAQRIVAAAVQRFCERTWQQQ